MTAPPPGKTPPDGPVVGIGACSVDLFFHMDSYPAWGTKPLAKASRLAAGGPAATALVTLARFGMATDFVGKVGDDALGAYVRDEFAREGVGTAGLTADGAVTTLAAAIVVHDGSGERTIIGGAGDGLRLAADEVDPGLLTRARHVVLDSHQPSAADLAATTARATGATVSLDAGTDPGRSRHLLDRLHVLVAPAAYFGEDDASIGPDHVVPLATETGIPVVVATAGAFGCLVVGHGRAEHLPAHPIDRVVDATGAGDVFHGALVYGLLAGWDAVGAARFATAAAAQACRGATGRAPLPPVADLRALAGV